MMLHSVVALLATATLALAECPIGQTENQYYGRSDLAGVRELQVDQECVPYKTGAIVTTAELDAAADQRNDAFRWSSGRKRSSFPLTKDWNPKFGNERKYSGPVIDQGGCGSCAMVSAVGLLEIWFNLLREAEAKKTGRSYSKIAIDVGNQYFCRQKARNRDGDVVVLVADGTPWWDQPGPALRSLYDRLASQFPDKLQAGEYPSEHRWATAHGENAFTFDYFPSFEFVRPFLLKPDFKLDPNKNVRVVKAFIGGYDLCAGGSSAEYFKSLYEDQQALRAADKPASARRGVLTLLRPTSSGKYVRKPSTTSPVESKCIESTSLSSQIGYITPLGADLNDIINNFESTFYTEVPVSRAIYSPMGAHTQEDFSREDHQRKLKSMVAALQFGPISATLYTCGKFGQMTDGQPFDMALCNDDRGIGHAVIFHGYSIRYKAGSTDIDDRTSFFMVQNSWPRWGDGGFGNILMTYEGTWNFGNSRLPLVRPSDSLENPLLPPFLDVDFHIPLRNFRGAKNVKYRCSDTNIVTPFSGFVDPPLSQSVALCNLIWGEPFKTSVRWKMPWLIFKKVKATLVTMTDSVPAGNPTLEVTLDGEILQVIGNPSWKRGSTLKSRTKMTDAYLLDIELASPNRVASDFEQLQIRVVPRDAAAITHGGTFCGSGTPGRCMSRSRCEDVGGRSSVTFAPCGLWNDFVCCSGSAGFTATNPTPVKSVYLKSFAFVEVDQARSAALKADAPSNEQQGDRSAASRAFNVFSAFL